MSGNGSRSRESSPGKALQRSSSLSLDLTLMFTIQKLLLKFRARSLIRKMTRPRPGLGSDTSLSMRHDDGSLGNHISA